MADPFTTLALGGASAGASILSGVLGGNAAKNNAKRLQDAQNKANAANELRYQQLLAGADEMRLEQSGALNSQYAQLLNMNDSNNFNLKSLTDSNFAEMSRLNDSYNLNAPIQRNNQRTQSEVGNIGQSFLGRGLYNSTIAQGAEVGANREGSLREEEIRNRYTDRTMDLRGQYNNQSVGQLAGYGDQSMNLRSRYSDLLQGNIRDYYGARQGVIERRTDAQPNPALYQTQGSALGSAIGGIGPLGTQLYGQYQNQQYNDRYLDILRQAQRARD